MVIMPIKSFVTLLCFFCCVSVSFAAELTLQLNRTEFSLDEAFELSISSKSATSGNINLSELQQDFEILDQYKQSSVQFINGNMNQSTVWIYSLVAKRAGKLTLPAISIGNDATKAREITVKAGVTQGKQNDDIVLEAEIEQTSAYVQQQFIYTQRLFFAKQFRSDSTLTRPHLKEGRAEVELLGKTERTVKRNGRDYHLLTRRFAIIPQASGTLVFAPSVFSGTMRATSQRLSNNRFGFNTRARRVRVISKEASIEIKPRPTAFTGKDWIIANDFSLHLSWSAPPTQIEAGKPISVVLAAIADGLRAEQLPEINLQAPAGIKLYPEKPSFKNERNLEGIVGTMNKRIVLVPTGGGEFILPALSIAWWNSKTNQQEEATLEAVTLNISGTPMAVTTQPIVDKPKGNPLKTEQPTLEENPKLSSTLVILLSVVGILLAALLGGLFIRWKASKQHNNISKQRSKEKQQQIITRLEQACATNNAFETQRQLQQWMQRIKKTPAQHTNSALQQIKQLHQALYAKEKGNWQGGQALWQTVTTYQAELEEGVAKQAKKQPRGLEPLYY